MLSGSCLSSCPTSYQPSDDYTTCVKKAAVLLLENGLTQKSFVPFPYLIITFIVGISVVIAKFQTHETFVAGALTGICSLVEWSSWVTLLIINERSNSAVLQNKYSQLITAALVLNLLCNIASYIAYRRHLLVDAEFQQWLESSPVNRHTNNIVRFFSLLVSHKFGRIVYSRYFGFSFFKAKLSSIDSLFHMNLVSGLSLLIVSIPMFAASGALAYYQSTEQQLFITSLDVVCVTIIMIIFMICETQKPKNFFDHEAFAEGQSYLNNSRMLPYEILQRLDGSLRSPMYNSRLNKFPSNSNITEFNEDHRIVIEEKVA